LQEDKDNYYIRAELPGIKKDKIKIELENNQLRIHAVKEEEKDVENKKYHFSEISYGSFTRNFSLPNAVNSKHIKANYEDGVLNIIIPKSVESKAQQINIE
jgi:HSP20 family protein